jgi:hypothetical protein
MLACDTSGFEVKDHFHCVRKTVEMPVGGTVWFTGLGFFNIIN